jgi:uncharacterized protein (DUF1800 family)
MAPNPLRPLASSQFDYWKALHLLNRAGFGGTPESIRALANLGLSKAVDSLVDFDRLPEPIVSRRPPGPDGQWDSSIMRPPTAEEQAVATAARRANDEETLARLQRERGMREVRDREQLKELREWWMTRFLETNRPLEEKLTLFWHGHFATGYRTIEDSFHMAQQNELFRANAAGNFRKLVEAIVRDPAMIKYLDNDENRRQRPNENLARELMELFVLGEGNGYTEQDIKEGARALTGYTFIDDSFVYREAEHDSDLKVLFGKRGRWDGSDFVRFMFERPGASEFLCLKLTRFFVTDLPGSPSVNVREFVTALARLFRDSRFEIKPVLRAIFNSEFFYAPTNAASVIKSPIQLTVQAIRSLKAPVRSVEALTAATDLMGQALFQPPNVKGWEGGRSWINTATLFVRQNFLVYLLTGRRPTQSDWATTSDSCDLTHLLADLRQGSDPGEDLGAESTARFLLRFTLASKPHPDRIATLVRFLESTSSAPENDRLLGAMTLVTAMPEYQLC